MTRTQESDKRVEDGSANFLDQSSQVKIDYTFLTGYLNPDIDYFKSVIRAGCEHESNRNFDTNVIGLMTSYSFFLKDKKFLQMMFPVLDWIDANVNIGTYHIEDAWGLIEGFGMRTKKHTHGNAQVSGVIYLDDHDQLLEFPEINKKIKPEKGKLVLFSSFLEHFCKRITHEKEKYAISFNIKQDN